MLPIFRRILPSSLPGRNYARLSRPVMNRPRNRQARPPRNNTNTRNPRTVNPHDSIQNASANVPTMQQVVPEASVSIVLKADQRTGREVQGIVKDLLTRGNHPRGIKVRLLDGSIGRVQRMMTGKADVTSKSQSIPEFNHILTQSEARIDVASGFESANAVPSANLSDFIVNRSKGGDPQASTADSHWSTSPVAKCPICEEFEGDETAVSFHVQQHLDAEVESPG